MCPGETATSRRESQVSIVDIVPRCGPTRDMPCDHNLNPYFQTGMVASYGIVIQNLSPTGKDEVLLLYVLTGLAP